MGDEHCLPDINDDRSLRSHAFGSLPILKTKSSHPYCRSHSRLPSVSFAFRQFERKRKGIKSMNGLFVSKYDCSLFLLCPHETEAFNEVFSEEEALRNSVECGAKIWRNTLRLEFPDHIVCRQRFIMKTILQTAKSHPLPILTPSLCRAISFAIADLVERRVVELDAEQASSWRN